MNCTKILALTSLLVSCQSGSSDKQHPEPDQCTTEVSSDYLESRDSEANVLALQNFAESRAEILPSFDKTIPSSFTWKIVGSKLRLDGTDYLLSYSQESANWTIVNNTGATVGLLSPFRTSSCAAVSQLKLTMFIPEEEASAWLTFNSL